MSGRDTSDGWVKLPAITGSHSGCVNCGPHPDVLPLDTRIAVGFGSATLSKDGVEVWSEDPNAEWERSMTVDEAERIAQQAPTHDWQIELHGPLSSRTYQRHGTDTWVLVKKGEGFA